MKKHVEIAPPPSLSDRLNESSLLHWITQNTRNITYLVLVVAAVGILAYRMLNYWSAQPGYHYFTAENDYTELHTLSGEEQAATAAQLISLLEKQPDLQQAYDGKLAQLLLIQGDVANAEPLFNRALKRTSQELSPPFAKYAETTLLIAKEQYSPALQQAEELQKSLMENPQKVGSTLLPANMLRIAMLQNKLGLTQEEALTWQNWKELVKGENNASLVGFQKVTDAFREGTININNFVQSREKSLK